MPSDAPERITVTKTRRGDLLIDSKGEPMTLSPGYTEHVEYVRADLLAARDAEIARLNAFIDQADAMLRANGSTVFLRNVMGKPDDE